MTITIVGLGPGDPDLLTRQAWRILSAAETVFLRTARHPVTDGLPAGARLISFDEVYARAADFESVYADIAAQIVGAGQNGPVVYAVPGDPAVGEATVTAIRRQAQASGVPVAIVPGVSFLEPTLTALELDGLDGLQLFDALDLNAFHHPPLNVDVPLLIAQVYNRMIAGELKLTLMRLYPDEHEVVLVHGAGAGAAQLERLPLYEIDRSAAVAHLTSLYVPPRATPGDLSLLAETAATLRAPGGCPWDQEQTPQTLRPGFVEEFYEVLTALDDEDPAGLLEELGDLLFHIVMQAQMAAENGEFTLTEIIAQIDAKLKYRHPHVWGDVEVADAAEVVANWERLKAAAKDADGAAPPSLLDNIPAALPALAQSQKIQGRVRKVGFDWPDIGGVYAKMEEEIAEIKGAATTAAIYEEVGDLLFVMVNLAKWLDVDAETALRQANRKFERRFRHVESQAAATGIDLARLTLAELEALWQQAKAAEGTGS